MPQDERNPARRWREIAAEASRERDPQRLLKLTEELERALEERYAELRASAQVAAVRKT